MSHSIVPYNVLREVAADRLPQRSRLRDKEPLGDALTTTSLAVGRRFSGVDGKKRKPIRTLADLSDAATTASALPDRVGIPVSLSLLDELLTQPRLVGKNLGPLSGTIVSAIGRAVAEKGLGPITSLLPVMRTMGFRSLRAARNGDPGRPQKDLVAFFGAGHEGGGIGYLLGTYLDRDAREHGDDDTEQELARLQVRARMQHLAAIRRELQPYIPDEILMLLRGERRFTEVESGAATATELWCAVREPSWKAALDDELPDAVVALEVPREWIRYLEYKFEGGTRTLTTLDSFFSDVERRDATVGAWSLLMSDRAREKEIPGADDVVVLDGCLRMPDGELVTPIVVLGEAESTVYAMPFERASALGDAGWDAVRMGLAGVYGATAGRSSHDQGLALTETFQHALAVAEEEPNRSANLFALRGYAHAVESDSHWLGGAPPAPALPPEIERRAA